jgi:hypothetical protein
MMPFPEIQLNPGIRDIGDSRWAELTHRAAITHTHPHPHPHPDYFIYELAKLVSFAVDCERKFSIKARPIPLAYSDQEFYTFY